MLKIILLVGIGGFLGSICRYLTGFYLNKYFPIDFPFGTLSVNLVGCLFIGMAMGLAGKQSIHDETRIFLTTGFCGGFTTFSTFAYENIIFLINKEYSFFFLNAFISMVIGLTAVWIGLKITG